jgi:hypothetical protein
MSPEQLWMRFLEDEGLGVFEIDQALDLRNTSLGGGCSEQRRIPAMSRQPKAKTTHPPVGKKGSHHEFPHLLTQHAPDHCVVPAGTAAQQIRLAAHV